MSRLQAQGAVTLSAFVVAVVFAYRKLTEQSLSAADVPETGHFVVGFGFTYITLSIVAQAAPELGGMFAVLVAAGDLLYNGKALTGDLSGALGRTKTATGGTATAPTAPAVTVTPSPSAPLAGVTGSTSPQPITFKPF